MKAKYNHPDGLLQPITILEWKWEVISMDFITCFFRTSKKHDSIMVVVDKLRKVAHFIAVNSTNLDIELYHIFIKDIVRLHFFPKNIISNKDDKFTSKFWKELFAGLGT